MPLMSYGDIARFAGDDFSMPEDRIKGRRKSNDLGPWETLANEILGEPEPSRDLKSEADDDGSIAPGGDDEDPGETEDGIGLSAGDAQQYTDDGGTDAHDAYEWESVQPRLREMFDLARPALRRQTLRERLQASYGDD